MHSRVLLEGDLTPHRREEGNVTTGSEIKVMHKARSAGCHQKLEEARNEFSPKACGGSIAPLTPWFLSSETDFKLLASVTVRE